MKRRISIPYPLMEAQCDANAFLERLSQRGKDAGMDWQNLPPGHISPRAFSWDESPNENGGSTISFSLWGGCEGFYVKGLLESFDWSPNGTAWRAISMRIHFKGENTDCIGGWGHVRTPDISGEELQNILNFHFHRYGTDENEARDRMNAALDKILPVNDGCWIPVISDKKTNSIRW